MPTPAQYFTGYFRIAQDPATTAALDAFIARFEKKYLVDLLGYELYLLFVADLNGTTSLPESARFTVIYNELYFENTSSIFYPVDLAYQSRDYKDDLRESIRTTEPSLSEGFSLMLKGFLYFEFLKEYGLKATPNGVVENSNENTTMAPGSKLIGLIEERYNEAVKSYKVIQNYIKANAATYPEFKGIAKERTHWGGAF